MRRLAPALTTLLLAAATPAAPDRALTDVADALADRAASPAAGSGRVALAVVAPAADGLREPLETALAGALSRRGFTVLPLAREDLRDAEAAARARAADHLLRVRAALHGGELVLAGEIVPTRPNFFLQRDPAARPRGSALVSASVPAGPALRALARRGDFAPAAIAVSPLVDLPEDVLALAAGATDGSRVRIAAVTATRVLLLAPTGELLAAHPLPPPPTGPRVRDPAAAVAIGPFEGGRIAYAVAGRATGEVLDASGDRLRAVAPLGAVPLAAGGAGALYGLFTPGRGTLRDVLSPTPAVADAPRGGDRALVAAAAAPRPGRVAFGVLAADGRLRLLGADLAPAAADVPGVGAGFALADLDGDGEPELVASSAAPGPADRLRVLRPGVSGAPLFASGPIDGALLAGAAADLTGDGVDDAVLAAVLPGGGSRLWLVTTDGGGER